MVRGAWSWRPLSAVVVLGLIGLIATSPARGQERGSEAGSTPAGWERFVVPVVEGGGSGLAFFPGLEGQAEVLDPRGFRVHMTNADDPGEELVHPAGEPFGPPAGRWRIWLQGEWSMTPSSRLIVFPPWRPGAVVKTKLVEVAPAGRVALRDDRFASDLELWLLAAGNGPREYELSRRRPVAEAADGVLMPAGPALAGLWDRREERWVAVGGPFDVVPGRTVAAPLARPAATSAGLVVYVEHPQGAGFDSHHGLALTVRGDGRELRPDTTVTTAWGLHAVWYDLPPGTAVLGGGNARLYLEPRTIELTGGEIGHFDGVLTTRPLLDVTMVLPSLLREKPLTLEVRKLPEGDTLAEVELPRTAGRHRFQQELVKGVLEVVLTTHVGKLRRQVDLTTEEEGFLALEPELIELFGTVRHGGEPHPATVRFQTVAGDTVEAAADEEGEYEALALQPLRWVDVDLAEVEQEPWRDFFAPPVRSSRQFDFDVPDAEVVVRVVDAATREGIAGASVAVMNEYLAPAAPGEEDDGDPRRRERRLGQSYSTDGEGVARLPPPRPGKVEIHASADGYRPADEQAFDVPDPPQDRELEIVLQPHGERVAVHVTLPDGSPAAGAEVLRVDPASGRGGVFSGRADQAGVVEVPVEPRSGLLLLKHPAAAFGVVDWQPWADEDRVEWSFPAAAERPLSVRVLDPAGEGPAGRAEVSLWVEGRRLSGPELIWLTGARPLTDPNGFWRAERLPRAPVRLLARGGGLRDERHSGALEALATEIRYPWPDQVEVRAIR